MGRPLQIGVTGGIGSGKTTVCRIFASLGIPVYPADERARWLSNHHPDVVREIRELLGPGAYDDQGRYNREFVASRVFDNAPLLKKLNAIVHPRVAADTRQWTEDRSEFPYLLKEAAIMNKAGDHNTLDFVVVVTAPEALRINRVLSRDTHRTKEEVRAILRNQLSDEQRLALADFVVRNDETAPLIPQVLSLHERFLREAEKAL